MSVRLLILRALVLTAITFGAGAVLYWLLGVTVLSAVLFAVACGTVAVFAARIQ